MISVFGWLSDKGQRNFVTFRINSFVYTSVLILFQSDREPPPVMHCVAYFNFENIREGLEKVQLPWCITECQHELCRNIDYS